jgi:hypothetical protein
MAKFALLVELKAKSGKESEVEAFLKKEAALVRGEPGRCRGTGRKSKVSLESIESSTPSMMKLAARPI